MAATCPRDGGELVEVDRSGVKIDACRTCRGVWLDRGELDKLLELEAKDQQRDEAEDEAFLREITGGDPLRDASAPAPGVSATPLPSSAPPASSPPPPPKRSGFDSGTAEVIFTEFMRHKHKKHKKKSKLSLLGDLMDV